MTAMLFLVVIVAAGNLLLWAIQLRKDGLFIKQLKLVVDRLAKLEGGDAQ